MGVWEGFGKILIFCGQSEVQQTYILENLDFFDDYLMFYTRIFKYIK